MDKGKPIRQEGFITRYTRNAERAFFFYATLVMLIVWGLLRLTGE